MIWFLPRRMAAVAVMAIATSASAAPLPPVPPLDICGTVAWTIWLPPHTEPAVNGMSGSAGVTRHWPGRLAVLLDPVCTNNPDALDLANMFQAGSAGGADRDLAPGQAVLVLPEVAADALRVGRTLCVSGFQVSGDEGGTWTSFANLMQLPAALGTASLQHCGE